MTDASLLTQAYLYAARKHASQRRKGEAREPYVNHLAEVAALTAEAAPDDIELIVAAVLHDTLEDTDAEYEDIARRFGARVADLVAEVTDDKSLPKEERKRHQVESAAGKSARAKILKLCDKASNLRSIAQSPPDWSPERKADYLRWANAVAEGLRGVSPAADRIFDQAAEACVRALAAG